MSTVRAGAKRVRGWWKRMDGVAGRWFCQEETPLVCPSVRKGGTGRPLQRKGVAAAAPGKAVSARVW